MNDITMSGSALDTLRAVSSVKRRGPVSGELHLHMIKAITSFLGEFRDSKNKMEDMPPGKQVWKSSRDWVETDREQCLRVKIVRVFQLLCWVGFEGEE